MYVDEDTISQDKKRDFNRQSLIDWKNSLTNQSIHLHSNYQQNLLFVWCQMCV